MDTIAFVASGDAGTWILNISDPSSPKTISNIQTNGFTGELLVEDSLLFIVNAFFSLDTTIGLWIIDISNVYEPEILSYYRGITHFGEVKNALIKSGEFIYLTQKPGSGYPEILEIIDVSDPHYPLRVSTFSGSYTPHNIGIKENALYLGTNNGLRILDIMDPYTPVEVNIFRPTQPCYGASVLDTYLYADGGDTLFILDITVPFFPSIVGRMHRNLTGYSTLKLNVTQEYLYWISTYLGVVDIRDKSNPVELTRFLGASDAVDIYAQNEFIYLADGWAGLYILRNNLITDITDPPAEAKNYTLYQNFPNPFNSETIIQFEIPYAANVRLDIYNILGQKIDTIIDETLESGIHTEVYKPQQIASGVYIYKLSVNNIFLLNKFIYLK
jgi:hypothetical protein